MNEKINNKDFYVCLKEIKMQRKNEDHNFRSFIGLYSLHYYIESIFPDVIKSFIAIINTPVELNTIHDA